MQITSELVKSLREKTGVGMMDCKKALTEAKGDAEKAIDLLRKKGIAAAAKRAAKATSEGVVESYIHLGGKVGVLVEVNCETDFVARNYEFQSFVHDVAMHIAAMNPQYLSQDEIPEGILDHEKEILKQQTLSEGKPEKVVEKIIGGRMEKFYSEMCLLNQPFIKDQSKTIQALLSELAAKIGENIAIRRFTRYQIGEK